MMTIELSEADFQLQVTDLAERRQWTWMHIERMGNPQGRWRTPVSGPLGRGWPDLVLVRDSALIFVELKTQRGQLTVFQKDVRAVLVEAVPYYVWRPSDWAEIIAVLS